MKKKLTIAVPTYNRLNSLKKCLSRIQAQDGLEYVEIVVSDNASTDGTSEFMKEYCIVNTNTKYFRNETNIGADGNFLNCFNKARGEYVMLLSDDDYLLPDALSSTLLIIDRKPTFIHLNTCNIVNDVTMECNKPRFIEGPAIVLKDKNEFLKMIGIYVTFLSSLVFRTEYVNKIVDKEQYLGTCFLQSHIALRTMENSGHYIINSHTCLGSSPNKKVSYDLYYVWCESYRKLIIDTGVKSGFDPKMLRDIFYTSMRDLIIDFVIQFRRDNPKDAETWNKISVLESTKDLGSLSKWFKFAVYCPRILLPFEKFYIKVIRKLVKVNVNETMRKSNRRKKMP